ncbi:MAG: anaerobic glycerol-3-phosphate dehydrogenase subunit B [Deltaproteobacteria bacterium]|nr:anaerobic glycerol-3-phosphate dehydrogenase subunit B [Deltaproteobacteria bacterium]
MSVIEYDVIIIGAGVAGLTAGAYLAGRGFRVALVTKGEPTACLSTGGIDVCSYNDNPLLGIKELPSDHPFHLVDEKIIRESLDNFQTAMNEMDMPYKGSAEKNRFILSALGTFKTSCLVPSTMEAAAQDAKESIHIITFKGLKDFYPGYIISRRKNAKFSIYDAGVSSTMGIASHFEEREFLEKFLLWLEKQNIYQDKIAFPAVLGLESATKITDTIAILTGKPVFEIPTLPPSMPGRRLFNALKKYFRKKGGEIYWGWPVIGVEKSEKIIEAVITSSKGRPNSLNGKAFILATGSFVGGGLTATREAIIENVFNLPVHVPGPRETWFDNDYFSLNHGIGRAGIIADSSLRPAGTPMENVFVCGGILANTEILKNGCGHGLALATAHLAAKSCMEYIR